MFLYQIFSLNIDKVIIEINLNQSRFYMMIRQGDVLLRKVDKLPKNAIRLESKILLEGEVTGHAHRIDHGYLFQFQETWQPEPTIFVKAEEGTTLVHEEHGPINLDPGIYQFIRQREYDPDTMSTRWVED